MLNARRFVNPLSIYRCLILTVSCFDHGTASCKLYFSERYCLRTPGVGRGQMGSEPLPLMKIGQNKHGNQMPYLLINDKDFRPLATNISHFWENAYLRTMDLFYARTYSGHFWNMSIFDDSRAVWVLSRKWVVSENQSFLDEGAIVTPFIGLVLGGEVPRLNHGPICFPVQNT